MDGSSSDTQTDMRFFDSYVPLLPADTYTITAGQTLKGTGDHDADETFPSVEQVFTVSGPRFSLDPTDVQREFPAPNTQGVFDSVLPHIVMKKRALPWERKVFASSETPWLALLILQEGEILDPVVGTNAPPSAAANPTRGTSITLTELQNPASGTVAPTLTIEDWEDPDQATCRVIDVSPATFQAQVPDQADLPYLAHGREVTISRKSETVTVRDSAAQLSGEGTQWFSVIIAGRLPSPPTDGGPGQRNIAHLVSLEGLAEYVAEDADTPGRAFPSGTERVRLVSLSSWTFTCLPEVGQSFQDLMMGLIDGGQIDPDDLLLRFPVAPAPAEQTPAQDFARRALQAGYVPRRLATRQGEDTFSWYRSPFVAQLPERFDSARDPFALAAQATVYDEDNGLFDQSYAVAFEIGRLVALSSATFGKDLLRWRRHTRQELQLVASRLESQATSSLLNAKGRTLDLATLASRSLVSRSFVDQLITHIDEGLSPVASPGGDLRSAAPRGVGDIARKGASGNPVDALRAALEANLTKAARADPESDELLAPLVDFLADLYLLQDVPFGTLVPDARMLPAESVRFFYVDRNWLDCLIDGALSIGLQTSLDASIQGMSFAVIREAVYARIHELRDELLGIDTPHPGDLASAGFAGMLLRSSAVAGWPGLEVAAATGLSGNDPSGAMGLLRMAHLSPDILLVLFPAVPSWVTIDEPQEGLHFGVESNDQVFLRQLDGSQVGFLVEPQESVVATFDSDRRLQIPPLLEKLKEGLGLTEDLGPADFAVEMVDVPERMVFQLPSS